ncbi:MAG: acetyltransferase [Bacteroidales bacterium]|nr:acetyltransferase [Bacteroidales bacterium]
MEQTDKVYLYGASGHAKVVRDIVKLSYIDVQCLIDDNPEVNELDGLTVVHSAEGLSPIIVTIGDCLMRRKIVEKLGDREYMTVVHPKAILADSVKLGMGTVVMAGALLNPYTVVGDHCIINTGASLDHDVKIGDFVHIAPHCTVCGGSEVGGGTWLGAGSTVIQGVKIGMDCYIGAGSVVVKDIPDGCLCYGNPARVIKQINNMNMTMQKIELGGGKKTIF